MKVSLRRTKLSSCVPLTLCCKTYSDQKSMSLSGCGSEIVSLEVQRKVTIVSTFAQINWNFSTSSFCSFAWAAWLAYNLETSSFAKSGVNFLLDYNDWRTTTNHDSFFKIGNLITIVSRFCTVNGSTNSYFAKLSSVGQMHQVCGRPVMQVKFDR